MQHVDFDDKLTDLKLLPSKTTSTVLLAHAYFMPLKVWKTFSINEVLALNIKRP
jgi:hypothetical protein